MAKDRLSRRTFLQLATAAAAGAALPGSIVEAAQAATATAKPAGAAPALGAQFIGKLEGPEILRDALGVLEDEERGPCPSVRTRAGAAS